MSLKAHSPAQYFIKEGAYTANGISVWPSSSVPAHTAIITGCYPRNTDVTGQRQFDRATRKHTSYIGLGALYSCRAAPAITWR